jgi:Cu(I)/Ag(I) efflux system membrane fusion protein/cobalt-zinc-cadmium efflux system membrane fusion protein
MTKQVLTVLLAGLAVAAAAQQRTQQFGVTLATAQVRALSRTVQATAAVAADEATELPVTARFDGWIGKLPVNTTYQRVRRGEVLCTIYSPDLYAAEQDYAFAAHHQQLLAASSVPGVAAGGRALLADAAARLRQMQVPEEEITRLIAGGEPRQEFALTAPRDGIVEQRGVLPGEQVHAGTRLFTLIGLAPIWANAAVAEADLGLIEVGQQASLSLDAFPGRMYQARVAFITPKVDAASRTAAVRLVLPNVDRALTPGMFGRVRIAVDMGRRLTVPASAVLQSGETARVFVAGGDGRFTQRAVSVGPQVGEVIVIRSGLRAGERVAAGASFLIASEAQLSAAAGSFAPPPPGVAGAPAAATASLLLTTDPSPARKGANTFRVLLRDAHGAPIVGAQVTLTLAMPAMPAMGMAAKLVRVAMHDAGGGRYQGSGALDSGGQWQVTIVASQGGRLLAREQTSLRAEGGM